MHKEHKELYLARRKEKLNFLITYLQYCRIKFFIFSLQLECQSVDFNYNNILIRFQYPYQIFSLIRILQKIKSIIRIINKPRTSNDKENVKHSGNPRNCHRKSANFSPCFLERHLERSDVGAGGQKVRHGSHLAQGIRAQHAYACYTDKPSDKDTMAENKTIQYCPSYNLFFRQFPCLAVYCISFLWNISWYAQRSCFNNSHCPYC